MSLIDKNAIINKYADLFGNSLKKLHHFCKFILSREIHDTENFNNEISSILTNEPNKFLSMSDVFLSSVKPFYELLLLNFFPHESNDSKFSPIFLYPSYVYPLIQSSILIFTKKLTLFNSLICKSIKENQTKIDNFEEKFGINTISKSIVIIDKNSKINYNDQLKDGCCNTPIELIDVYSQYLCDNLSNNNYLKGINHLNTITEMMKNNIKNFNEYKIETKELDTNDIPEHIKNLIVCELDEDILESPSLSNFISTFQKDCNNIETAKNDERIRLKQISIDCDVEFKEIFKNIYSELGKLDSSKKCENKLAIQNIDVLMKNYLKKLNELSEKIMNFVTNQDIEMETKFKDLLNEMELDENIYSDEIFVHLTYLPKIIKELKLLDKYINKLEIRVDLERRVSLNYLRLESIDKSILKYMCETIMRQDVYLHNYLKFNWIKILFNCSINDCFQDFNLRVANSVNNNYLLLIGSIYNRLPVTFLYSGDSDSSNFFKNNNLVEQIKNEYYEGLKHGLGNFLKKILLEMICVMKKFNKNQLHVSIESKPNLSLNIGKHKLTDDYTPCFCTLNYQNTPVNLLHNTVDYLVTVICVNNSMNDTTFKPLHDQLVDLLKNETFYNLTETVYARWSLWLCLFSGSIQSQGWDSVLEVNVNDSNLKELALKHLKNYLDGVSSLKFKLIEDKSSYESKIDYERLREIVKNPKKFPDKNEFLTKIKNNSLIFSPNFSKTNELETKFIILNKLGKLSCSTIYNYQNYIFSPINIQSKELKINFI